jgi:L-rhamnose isomerase
MTHLFSERQIRDTYALARERYASLGVDADAALAQLATIPISLHCWQGDDVGGFEAPSGPLGAGLATTGNYPGKARTAEELRGDLNKVYSLIPGRHRLALHAIYAETGGAKVPRNELQPAHFDNWIGWAKQQGLGLDFNPTLFGHPMADSGMTLASYDAGIRNFWIEHCIACRYIGEHMGRELGTPCVNNLWIADGLKDTPADRKTPRSLLKDALDKIYVAPIDPRFNLDSVEGKLFGLGSESYVVGSHEFYLGYAVANKDKVLLTLDSGHFHPTETIADKLSAVLLYVDAIMLHVSRGVRWDSDHVITLNDDLQAIAAEIVRGEYLDRVHIGLDYFDASINRVAAYVIGVRNMQRALLVALLEPSAQMKAFEREGDFTSRLALQEALKTLPAGAAWDYFCLQHDLPVDTGFMAEIKAYEAAVLAHR